MQEGQANIETVAELAKFQIQIDLINQEIDAYTEFLDKLKKYAVGIDPFEPTTTTNQATTTTNKTATTNQPTTTTNKPATTTNKPTTTTNKPTTTTKTQQLAFGTDSLYGSMGSCGTYSYTYVADSNSVAIQDIVKATVGAFVDSSKNELYDEIEGLTKDAQDISKEIADLKKVIGPSKVEIPSFPAQKIIDNNFNLAPSKDGLLQKFTDPSNSQTYYIMVQDLSKLPGTPYPPGCYQFSVVEVSQTLNNKGETVITLNMTYGFGVTRQQG